MLKGSLKKLVKGIASVVVLYVVFFLLVQAVEQTENKYKGDFDMPSSRESKNAATRSESVNANLTKEEKNMFRDVRRHYGFASDRELIVALTKRAHLNIIKNK